MIFTVVKQLEQLQRMSWQKSEASTGFELMTSVYCSTTWAMKPCWEQVKREWVRQLTTTRSRACTTDVGLFSCAAFSIFMTWKRTNNGNVSSLDSFFLFAIIIWETHDTYPFIMIQTKLIRNSSYFSYWCLYSCCCCWLPPMKYSTWKRRTAACLASTWQGKINSKVERGMIS